MLSRRRLVQGAAGLLVPAWAAQAGVVTQTRPRYHATPSGGGGGTDWADTYISNVSTIGTELATPGRVVGIEVGSNFTGLSQQLTASNGATMDIVTGGSFDGNENAVRMYPPTALPGGGDAGYACWLRNLNLWNSGANNIAQMNFRICVYYGTRYFDLAPHAKSWGFMCSDTLGVGQNNRIGVFDYRDPVNWTQYRYPYITVTTRGSYHEPEDGSFIEEGVEANKLIAIHSAASHASSPPRTAGEWLCFEDMFDLRTNRGNANGIHRLRVWTRDGVVSSRYLDVPLSWDSGWDFGAIYAESFEGLGFYFNQAGTANANNFVMYSHATFAANMGINETIDPPPGFVL